MTSILFLTENIWRNQFRSNYLKNEKLFLKYFLDFRNLHEILNICNKKMSFIADLFAKLRTPKNVVRYISKKPVPKDPLTGNMVNAFKHCCDLNHSTVTILSDHFEGKWVEKVCFSQTQSLISVC